VRPADTWFAHLKAENGPGIKSLGTVALRSVVFGFCNATAANAAIIALSTDAAAASLVDTTFSDNNGWQAEAPATGVEVYTDQPPVQFVVTGAGTPLQTRPLNSAPANTFFVEDDQWLLRTEAVRARGSQLAAMCRPGRAPRFLAVPGTESCGGSLRLQW
jgi:hypothetical protein